MSPAKPSWQPDQPDIMLFLERGETHEEVQLTIRSYSDKPCVFFPKRLRWTVAPHKGREREIAVRFKEGTPERVELPPSPYGSSSSISVTVSYAGLAAGMYALSVHPLPHAASVENRSVSVQGSSLGFYLPNPVKPPEARVGQTFLCLPRNWRQPFPYRDMRGQPVDWRKVALRVWKLTRVELDHLEFAIEGLPGRVRCTWEGTVEQLPTLLPIVEEPTVRQLRARYEGRQVWGYGGIGAIALMREQQASASIGFERLKPARLLLIRRVWLPWVWLPLGSALYLGGRNYGFYAHHPLVVKLQPLGKPVSSMFVDGVSLFEPMQTPQRLVIGFYAMYADAWDFERAYSLQNPLELSKRWSARERRALRTGELVKGLSHEVVAWIWGWPCLYGTKEQLKRIDKWIYENVPFEAELFFRNGWLTRWYIPRNP